MLLVDLTHTSHTHARTGIQRVARSLYASLDPDAVGICHDPYADAWRPLRKTELANIAGRGPVSRRRSAQWPLATRWTGRLRRWLGRPAPTLPDATALVVPEIFSAQVGRVLPDLLAQVRGPRIAIFHDALPLQLPELTPPGTVARFPAYLRELLRFDGIAAVSRTSRDALAAYWDWLGARNQPPIVPLPLGIARPGSPAHQDAPSTRPIVLCVGSLEPRKNHGALLTACTGLWKEGLAFELHLIGLAGAGQPSDTVARIRTLQTEGCPIRYDGPVDDPALETAYAACAFTVYPSTAEGFGLPVAESLIRGKPCICSSQGAVGEISRGGGCVPLPAVDAPSLAAAIRRLIGDPAERATLARIAGQRTFPSWDDYSRALRDWMKTLPRR